ncbi:succinate dehydrogenase, hydrophobic membrane anchor protein [Reinekea thalattae]|uniref:Succinate dehydrogenase hydrophobic membrane anchor subunit n=1 Tax=Reinekea thalattae TaxID=2593301 RepID=A0A5C8Z9A7_9GAMM|nr:succinate dehydrogenase, hydrophobic membrane anchor protein [Reinekea thalattae]TXR53436.1 succinate dehydrogenase, hydrophobic membrane anchor protein [Reinekea thalattae]
MVKSVTSFSRNGLVDWIVQRVSAVLLASYTLFMVVFFAVNPDLSFQQWHALFANSWFKLFSVATLLAIVAHVWVGLWTVATDYIHNTLARFLFLLFVAAITFVYFVFGFTAVWGA